MTMVSNTDGKNRDSQTKIRRSMFRNEIRFRDLRFNMSSYWRKNRISTSREARAAKIDTRALKIRVSNPNIARSNMSLAKLRHEDDCSTIPS
jgi:hypothetical protein